eukprot:3826748-Pyramimonas_sp.AAC.1
MWYPYWGFTWNSLWGHETLNAVPGVANACGTPAEWGTGGERDAGTVSSKGGPDTTRWLGTSCSRNAGGSSCSRGSSGSRSGRSSSSSSSSSS